MLGEHGGGWVALEFPEERTIDRVVWSRDRKDEFTDRLVTNYVIEVASAAGEWRTFNGPFEFIAPGWPQIFELAASMTPRSRAPSPP
jgi:hypothetical protein